MFCTCWYLQIFNTESTSIYVVSATYSFKVWEGGTSNFYEETNYPPLSSHPVSSGLYDLLSFSVRLTTLFFASSWKAIPTQTNLVDRSPQHGEKRMRCPSESKGHQMFIAISKFFPLPHRHRLRPPPHVCLDGATFR